MGIKSNFRTTGISCLLSVLVALSGMAFSPAQANASVPTNGQYVCTTGVLRADGDNSAAYLINNGVISSGYSCAGAVVIPEGVTSIERYAFRNASSLSSVNIPSSVTLIGEAAFQRSGLNSITFAQESQLTTIDGYAFAGTPLTSITIPASLQMPDYEDLPLAFGDAASLAAINVDPNNQTYSSIDGVLFNEGATTLVMYPFGKTETSYTIPSSVTTISAGAFYAVEALTSITIPASVTTIGEYAFEEAYALIDFNFLGNAPTDVDVDAFEGISSGAKAHIKSSATGFGAPGNPWTWNGLIVQADLKEVTYNSAGGSAVTPGVVTQGGSIQTAPVSTRAGYTLTGWSTTANGSALTFPYTPTADITLFAIWTGANTSKKTAISSYAAKFSAGSSVVTQTGKGAIKKIVSKSGKDAKYTVTGVATKVAGVSDSRVKGLAKARAEKVKAYLITLGVKKSNITIKVMIVESGITPKTAILAKYLTK